MTAVALYVATLLVVLAIIPETSAEKINDYDYEALGAPEVAPYVLDDGYLRQMQEIINAYRRDINNKMVVDTNAHVKAKYRTWKRNADLINSLLALPKGMNDAGRR